MHPFRNSNRSGFSLVETLIVVVIAAAVVVVVSNFGVNTGNLNNFISNEFQSKSDIAQTLQIMSNEIRSAVPSAAGAYSIDSASTSSFAFYDSVNANGTVDHVRYFLSSSTIYRGVIAPTGTPATYPTSSEVINDVIDNVVLASGTPLFSYYDSSYTGSGSPLSTPISVASVRLVNITFYAVVNKNSSQPSPPQFFSTLIDIRNLNTN